MKKITLTLSESDLFHALHKVREFYIQHQRMADVSKAKIDRALNDDCWSAVQIEAETGAMNINAAIAKSYLDIANRIEAAWNAGTPSFDMPDVMV